MAHCKLCDREHKARGFCALHYRQCKLGIIDQDGNTLRPLLRLPAPAVCTVEGCQGTPVALGLCSKHYQRKALTDPEVRREEQAGLLCKIKDCTVPARSRGFCARHYSNFKQGVYDDQGNQLRELAKVSVWGEIPCVYPGCTEWAKKKGFCGHHYKWLKSGLIDSRGAHLREFNAHPPRKGYRSLQNGYIKKMSKGHPHADQYGYVLEHRLVMEEHIGRHLEPGEVVHHLNGVRDDNRIENLQLLKGRKEHHPFHAPIQEMENALVYMEGLVHEGMEGGPDIKIRLQRLVRRLRGR